MDPAEVQNELCGGIRALDGGFCRFQCAGGFLCQRRLGSEIVSAVLLIDIINFVTDLIIRNFTGKSVCKYAVIRGNDRVGIGVIVIRENLVESVKDQNEFHIVFFQNFRNG